MQFTKPALPYDEQAALLLSRGLTADKNLLIERLKSVSYYRLCAYWHPFKRQDNTFEPGTSLAVVWDRYVFDRHLRLFVIDAIERIEVAVRSRLVYELTQRFGPFAHLDPRAWQAPNPAERNRFLDDLHDSTQRSRETFVAHFRANYDEYPDLPLWAAAELMTFGNMLTLFKSVGMHVQRSISQPHGLSGRVLESWLLTLNYVRNLCAHHARLWNRELAIKPLIPDPRNQPAWHVPVAVDNRRIFAVLTLLHVLMKQVAPQSRWKNRLFALYDGHPGIPLRDMGMPADWRNHPLWQ